MQVYLPKPSRHDHSDLTADTSTETAPRRRLSPPIAGNAFAIVDNGWDVMPELTQAISERLKRRGATEVIHMPAPVGRPLESQFLDEIASKVAGAVTGLGN